VDLISELVYPLLGRCDGGAAGEGVFDLVDTPAPAIRTHARRLIEPTGVIATPLRQLHDETTRNRSIILLICSVIDGQRSLPCICPQLGHSSGLSADASRITATHS
jgi:hypothetical protein